MVENKKEIKALVFDIGGVVASENNLEDHYIPLCKDLDIDKDKFFELRKKYIPLASSGKITSINAIKNFSEDLGLDNDIFLKKWIFYKKKSIRKNLDLIMLLKDLKKKGYIIGCLSGVMDPHHDIGDKIGIYDVFDFKILSYQVGINKPDIEIYELLLKKTNLDPKEIIVIDDMQECLDSAKKLGLNTILFKSNKQLIKDLRELGVKI